MKNATNWTRIAGRVLTHPTTLRAAMRTMESMGQRSNNGPAEDLLGAILEMAGLQRKRGAAGQIGTALGWLTAGAALGAGATMASPAARPMVEDAIKNVSNWASDGWDNSHDLAESLRSQVVSGADNVLAEVGLQRVPSAARRMAGATAWIGVGIAAGIAASMVSRAMAEETEGKGKGKGESETAASANGRARETEAGEGRPGQSDNSKGREVHAR